MSLHDDIDFRNASDTGEPASDAIVPFTNGEPANQTILRRPPENNRARTDVLRAILREMIILGDLDRDGPTIYGGGVVTFNGAKSAYTGQFTVAADLVVVPFATPGGAATAPYLAATKATLNAGTFNVDELVFTSKYRQWETTGADPDIAKDANRISVEILNTGVVTVAVCGAAGEENNILITVNFGVTTCQDVLDAITASAPASALVVASLGVGTLGTAFAPKFSEAEWGADFAARFLRGGAGSTSHIITAAQLSAYFGAHAENSLEKGDTLAIEYDKLVELGSDGGRFQSMAENTGSNAIPASAMFNTRHEPVKIPGCVPICKCIDEDTLVFVNGAAITRTTPATLWNDSPALVGAELGLLATPLTDWLRIDDGPIHNPPTTIRQALTNADRRINQGLDEIEVARDSTVYGAQASLATRLDLGEAEVNTARSSTVFGAKASLDARLEAADQHAAVYVTVDQPAGTAGMYATLAEALAGLSGASGGTIFLRKGTYSLTAQQEIDANITIVGMEDNVVIENNLSTSDPMLRIYEKLTIENVRITSGASEYAIQANGGDLSCRNCFFAGYVHVEGYTATTHQFTQCTFSFLPTTVNGLLAVTQGRVTCQQCVFVGQAGIALILVSDAADTHLSIHDSTLSAPDGVGVVVGAPLGTADARVSFYGCYISVSPFTASAPAFTDSAVVALHLHFENTTINVENTATTILSSLVQLQDAESRLTVRNLRVNLALRDLGHTTYAASPFILECSASVVGLYFDTVKITNTGALAGGMFFIYLNPPLNKGIYIHDVTFFNMVSDVSGTIDMVVIGQGFAATGSGTVHLSAVKFQASLVTYGNASAVSFSSASLTSCIVEGCEVQDGVWSTALRGSGITLRMADNTVQNSTLGTSALTATVAAFGFIQFTGNTAITKGDFGSAMVVANAGRAVVSNNVHRELADTVTQSIFIDVTVLKVTINGNNAHKGITNNAAVFAPANLADTNVLT